MNPLCTPVDTQVRKGERASPVVFWKISDREEQEASDEGAEDDRRSRVFARGYSVFNAAQVDGYAAPALPVLPEAERIGHAEAFLGRASESYGLLS